MKKIFSDNKIHATEYHSEILNKKYFFKKIPSKNPRLYFVLYRGFLPFFKREGNHSVHQDQQLKVIARLPSFNRINFLLFGNYDCYFSSNIFSINSIVSFIITRIRGKEHGVKIKEFVFKKNNIFSIVSNYIGKIFISKSEYIISYSLKSNKFARKELGVPEERLYHIPALQNIDYDSYRVHDDRLQQIRDEFFSESKINVLFLGRIIPVKGIDILLKSLKPLNDKIHLIVAGDDRGAYATACKSYADKNRLDVIFTGQLGDRKRSRQVINFYKNADVLVLPNRYVPEEYEAVEVWSMVVDEALALSLPVIITDVTGCGDDLVRDKNVGRIVEQGSVDALRSALADVVENPEKWKKMGENGPDVLQFRNRINYNGWERLLQSVNRGE